jgi:hypothetical protein
VTATPTATATPGVPPTNDDWANASLLGVPTTVTGTSLWASGQTNEPSLCDGQIVGRTVWFKIVPAASGTLRANTLGTGFDTTLALYQGNTLVSLTPNACNNDESMGVLTSKLATSVVAGSTYYLQLGGVLGVGGPFTLQVALDAAPSPTPTYTPTPTTTPTAPPTNGRTASKSMTGTRR